jgi:hypothetical protein
MLAKFPGTALTFQTEGLVLNVPNATLPDQWLIYQGVNMAKPA